MWPVQHPPELLKPKQKQMKKIVFLIFNFQFATQKKLQHRRLRYKEKVARRTAKTKSPNSKSPAHPTWLINHLSCRLNKAW